MAHKKAGGSTNNGRDSISKRLGVKLFGGQEVKPGTLSFDSGAPNFTRVKTWAAARITHSLPRRTGGSIC